MKNLMKALKRRWNDYLERLAKVNQDLYGNRRLDCCDLNNSKGNKPHINNF